MNPLPRFTLPCRFSTRFIRLACAALLAATVLATAADAATRIIRVRQWNTFVNGTTDGSTWDKAFPELWRALEYARVYAPPTAENPVEFWVSTGIQKPDIVIAGDIRNATFALQNWMTVRGGFAGTESSPDQRVATAMTVLSGDIANQHFQVGAPPATLAEALALNRLDENNTTSTDNAYNVVTAINAVGVVLERLIIAHGHASKTSLSVQDIEDMYLADPTKLETSGAKRAIERAVAGGGLYIENSTASTSVPNVTINHCVFTQNYARGFGGGFASVRARVLVNSTHFIANLSRLNGGAYFGRDQHGVFNGVHFIRNATQQTGGAVAVESPVRVQAGWKDNTRAYFLGQDEESYKRIVSNSVLMAKSTVTLAPDNLADLAESLLRARTEANRKEASADLWNQAINSATTQDFDGMSNPYGLITKIMKAAKIGAQIAKAAGSDDVVSAYILDTIMPNFETYGTPNGWATLLAAEISKAMGTYGPSVGMYKDTFTFMTIGGGYAEFNDCRFLSNRAALDGSAIDAVRVGVVVNRSQFSENSAGNTATVNAAAFAKVDFNNSIFSGNTARRHSVVSLNQLVLSRLTNCTIVNNSSTNATGYAVAVETGSECRIINSILWGNTNGNGLFASGGADIFTARADRLDAALREAYLQADKFYFRFVGLTEIANSDVQGLSSLGQTWDRNNVEYLTNPGYTPEEGNLRVRIYMTDLAEEESAHDTWEVMVVGQGDRLLGRGNFSADPQLHSSFLPKFGSPALGNGSYKRLHSLYSTAGGEDFFGTPWPRYPATIVGIGAIATPSLPSGTGGEVAGRYFIRPTATGDGSGRNWANASSDLKGKMALPDAELWVAAGTYYPSTTNDRDAAFTLGGGTQAYGGFNGTETTRNERDYDANVTILSGLTTGNGSYHVIKHTGVTDAAVLDGFTIQGGRANGSANTDNARGGGIFHDNSQVILRNLVIATNTATSEGGGFYSRNGNTSLLTNVIFRQNTANKGGALYTSGSVDAERCQFVANEAVQYGGAVLVEQSAPSNPAKLALFSNTVFQGNRLTTAGTGSALYLRFVDLALGNVTVYGNRSPEDVGAGYLGSAVYLDTGSSEVRNSILYGNRDSALPTPSFPIEQSQIYVPYENIKGTAVYLANLIQGYRNTGGGGGAQRVAPNAVGNFDAAPNFATNTVLPQANSPFINRGFGNADPQRGADVAGNPRKVGPEIDPGAYEYQGASQVLFATVSMVRSFTADGPSYTFNFLATAPSGTVYTWMVNKNDGRGFVALPADSRITGQGTTSLTIAQPTFDMEGWSFRMDATGAASASVSGTLTGIARNRIYVNGAVATSGDGKSWATAYKTLPEATNASTESGVSYAEIWVAQGTYTTATTGSGRTFAIGAGKSLYGGFKGGETARSQRNPTLYPTILSGFQPAAQQASQHASAVLMLLPDSDATLPSTVDGFTIRDATQDALYIDTNIAPTISNCIIENRFATGVTILRGATLKNVVVRKNMKGGVRVGGGNVTLENVLIAQNERTSGYGGGLYIHNSANVTVKESTIADNYSGGRAGGIYLDKSTLNLSRSIVWANRDASTELGGDIELAQLARSGGTLTITNSVVEKLTAYAGGGNVGVHPLFNDPLNFNYSLAAQSPAIALNAGAYPYAGLPATTLNFTGMSPSSEERTSIFSKSFSLSWAASAGYSVTWQLDYGQGWVAASSPFATASSSSTGSTLLINSSSILPSLRVRAVTGTGVALPAIALKVVPPVIRYVRSDAPANGDGLSWATAYRHPNEALEKVPSLGVEIWIARGTYGNSGFSNRLIAGVTLFGGFVGDETSLGQRTLSSANPTRMLSSFRTATHYMVIAGKQVDSNIFGGRQLAVDGIRFESGSPMINTEGGGGVFRNCEFVSLGSPSSGSTGVSLRSSYPTFENCTFTGATESAVKVLGGSPTFRNCVFNGNINRYNGGGAINSSGSGDNEVTIDRCIFTNNSTTYDVGGAILSGGLLTVTNSVFVGNEAGTRGGAMYTTGTLQMANCTLTGNRAKDEGAGVFIQAGATIANSIFWGNRTPPDIVARANELELDQISYSTYTGAPTVRKTIVEGLVNYAGNDNLPYNPLFSGALGSPYTLTAASPAIGRADLAALDSLAPVAAFPGRLSGGTLDLGAYEFSGTPATVLQLTKAPPASTTLYSGSNASFSVAGESFLVGSTVTRIGTDVIWQKFVNNSWVAITSGVSLSNGNNESTLSLASLTESGSYRYLIPSRNFTSNTFALTVTPRPVIYVDQTAPAGGNGTSWGTAFRTIDEAVALPGAALEIRVAAGNYTPTTLTLRPGLFFRGGYPNTGTAAQRNIQNPAVNISRLNGGNIFYANGSSKTYNSDTGFEGFTITATRSGAMYVTYGANVFFRNCVFADAGFFGNTGTVEVDFGSTAIFEDCAFRNNNSYAVSVKQNSSVRIVRAEVFNNTRGVFFADFLGSLTIEDSRFFGNSIPRDYFLIQIHNTGTTSQPPVSVLTRNRFWGNFGAGLLLRLFGPVELSDSLFHGNSIPLMDVGYGSIKARHLTIADNTIAPWVDTSGYSRAQPMITHYSNEFELSNSILWNNRSVESRDSIEVQQIKRSGGTFLVRNNLIEGFASFGGSGNFATAPLFAGQTPGAAEFYQLLPQSPAIGAGLIDGTTPLDLKRTGRTGTPDLGALDFTGTAGTKLYLTSTPVAAPTTYLTARSFTVTGPSAGTNVQWWRWDGTQLVALDFNDSRLSVSTTADTSTVTLRSVNAGDTTGFVYTVNGTSFRSGILYLTPQTRRKVYINSNRVRANVYDYGDGSSWAKAYVNFATGYELAPDDCDLYVMASSTSAGSTYNLKVRSGIRAYGGFTSTEQTDIAQRPAVTGAETVLDRYYLTSSNANEATLFDGFSFSGGNVTTVSLSGTANPTFRNCIIAGSEAGLLLNSSTARVTLENCVFRDFRNSGVTVQSGTLTGANLAFSGGNATLTVKAGFTTINGATFHQVQAGRLPLIDVSGNSVVTLNRASVRENVSGSALTAFGGALVVRNSLLTGNAISNQGVINAAGGDVSLLQSTVYGNTGSAGNGGLFVSGGTLTVKNSIVWGNRGRLAGVLFNVEQQQARVTGGTLAANHNLIEEFATLGGTGNFSAFPFFLNPTAGDFNLVPLSPGINVGDAALSTAGFTTDLANAPRVVGSAPDLGAYEFQGTPATPVHIVRAPSSVEVLQNGTATFVAEAGSGGGGAFTWEREISPGVWQMVTNDGTYTVTVSGNTSTLTVSPVTAANQNQRFRWYHADGNGISPPLTLSVVNTRIIYVVNYGVATPDGTSWDRAYYSLDQALANWDPNAEIWVAGGTSTGHSFTSALTLQEGMRIYGGFKGNETKLADRPANGRTLLWRTNNATLIDQTGAPVTRAAVLDGFILRGGGARVVYLPGASPTIRNCDFQGNTNAVSLETYQAEPLIENCVFAGNYYSLAIREVGSSSSIVGSMFNNNYLGAAIRIEGNLPGKPTKITNTLFTNCRAGSVVIAAGNAELDRIQWVNNPSINQSGALRVEAGATAVVRNSLLAGNKVTGYAAPFFSLVDNYGTLSLINTTITNNVVEAFAYATVNVGAVRNYGTLTVTNSILWENQVRTYSQNPLNLTIEQQQLYTVSGTTAVTYSILSNLTNFANSHNLGYHPLFDSAYPGEYRLSRNSPALNAGDNAAAAGTTDLLGAARRVGTTIDLGACEFAETTGIFSLGLTVETDSAALEGFVPVSASSGGEIVVSGTPATIQSLLWEILVNGVWTPLDTGGDYTVFHAPTGTGSYIATLRIARASSDEQPDRSVRFRINGTGYESPTYLVTTSRRNIRYVSASAGPNGDGLTWSSAYNDLATAVANAPLNTEIWLTAGTYAGADITLRPTLRLYGAFAGNETARVNRTNRDLTTISHNITAPLNPSYPNDVAVFEGLRFLGNTVTLNYRGGAFRYVKFETGGGLRGYTASLLVEDSLFLNNPVALNTATDRATITRTTFTGNERAIMNASGLVWTIQDCTFDASVNRTNDFGAHYLNSQVETLTVLRSSFLNGNSRTPALSLGVANTAISFTDCLFSGNKTTFNGAGVFDITGSTVNFDRCTFLNNRADANSTFANGGVMRVAGGATVSLRNSYLAGNVTTAPALSSPFVPHGAIFVNGSTLNLTGVTLVNNTATAESLGGIMLQDATATIINSVLFGNNGASGTVEQRQLQVSGATTLTLRHTMIEGLATYTGDSLLAYSPRLGTVNNRLVPAVDSPLRDAGDGTVLLADEQDLLGNARTFGPGVDLGAIEPLTTTIAAALDIGLARRVAGGYLEITYDNVRGYTGLVWEINSGSGWQTFTVPPGADLTNGNLRTLRLPWNTGYEGAGFRLSSSTYTTASYVARFGEAPAQFGSILSATPASGSTAASTRPAISFTYDQAVAANQLTPASFVVHGSMHGRLQNSTRWGSVTTDPLSPVLTPGLTFSAGESIDVSSTREVFSNLGSAFKAYVSRFTIPWSSRYGRFRQGNALPTTGNVSGAAAGDINGDGKGDVMFTGDDGAWIYLGDGEGSFTRFQYGATGAWNAFALADFNGDGRVDFIGSRGRSSLTIETLDTATASTTSLLTSPLAYAGSRLLPGDFNGDGHQDVLVLGATTTDGEVLLLNHGDGTFSPAGSQRLAPAEDPTREAAVADLNHDGALDFVQLRAVTNDIVVWLNDGAGVFTSDKSVRVSHAQTFALTDLDRDGWTDLIVASDSAADSIHIFRNDQTGQLVLQRAFAAGRVKQLAAADFDADGDIDLLTITSTAADTLWTNASGAFTATALAWTTYNASAAAQLAVADLNADGAPDVAIPQTSRVTFWTPGNYFTGFTKTLAEATTLIFAEADFTATTTPNVNSAANVHAVDSYVIQSLPTRGTLKLNGGALSVGQSIVFGAGKTYTYTPTGQYYGPDSFRVAPHDYGGNSPGARILLDITRVVDAPVVTANTSIRVFRNQARALSLPGTHPENEAMTFTVADEPAHGSVSITGRIATYTPGNNYTGADTFTFHVDDAYDNRVTATVTIDVSDQIVVVNNTSTNANDAGSLANAINTVIAQGAGRITFDASLANATLSLATATDTVHGPTAALVTGYLELDATAAPGLTIQRSGGTANLRLFRVATAGTLVLKNLTLAEGAIASENGSTPARGAAIYNEGTLRLEGITFTNHYAHGTASAGAEGGAIYSAGGQLEFGGNVTFATNRAEDDNAHGSGGALFLRNGTALIEDVTFNGNVAPTTGANVHLLGDEAALVVDWADTVFTDVSAARLGAGTVTVRDHNPATYAVASFSPSVTRVVSSTQIRATTEFEVTTSSATATLSLTAGAYRIYGGSGNVSAELIAVDGATHTLRFAPPQAGNNGHTYGGYVTLFLTVDEDGISYTNESEVLFFEDYYAAPAVSDLDVYVIDGAPTAFTLTATHNTQLVTLELLATPEHGTLELLPPPEPTIDDSIRNYTYTPSPGFEGDDYLVFRANTSQNIPASARITFRNVHSSRVVTTAAATGPGSLADILAHIPSGSSFNGTQWRIEFPSALAGQTITLPTTALNTPAGPSAIYVSHNLTLDASAAEGLRLARADYAPAMRLITVAPGAELHLINLTLANGLALGAPGQPGRGGALHLGSGASAWFDGVTFEANTASGGAGADGQGGAIYNDDGHLSFDGDPSLLADNSAISGAGGAGRGGAIYNRNGSIGFYAGYNEPCTTFTGNLAGADKNLALIADGTLLFADFDFTNVDEVGTSAFNGGVVIVDGGYASIISGPGLLTVAPIDELALFAPSTRDVPLTLVGGVPETIDSSSPTLFAIAGTLANPILRISGDTFPSPHSTVVSLGTAGYSFNRLYATPYLNYQAPVANINQEVAVTMNQPVSFTLEADFNPNLTASYELLGDLTRIEEGMPVAGTTGMLNGTAPAFTFTPPAQFIGTIQFAYQITDSANNSAIGIVRFRITSGTPTATPDSGEAQSGDNVSTQFTATGGHSTNDTITYHVVSPPQHGTVDHIDGTGQFTYTTNHTGYVGNDSFTFRTIDSLGRASTPATFTINILDIASIQRPVVTGVPAAPGPLLPNSGVLSGDTNKILSNVTVTHGENDTLTVWIPWFDTGSVYEDKEPEEAGAWTHEYMEGGLGDYWQTIGTPEQITERLRDLVAQSYRDPHTTPKGTIWDASFYILIGDDRGFVRVDVPMRGLVEYTSARTNPRDLVLSTPPATPITFQFAPYQPEGLAIRMLAPEFYLITYPVSPSQPVYTLVTDLSPYGTLTGGPLTTVNVTPGEAFTYTFTPALGFADKLVIFWELPFTSGPEFFSGSTSVTIAVNHAPVANHDTVTRGHNVQTISVASLLANDTDPDTSNGDAVSFVSVAATSANGVVLTYAGGNITYAASALTDDDTFTYTITDSHGATATATVLLRFQNSPPTPANDIFERNYGQPLTLTTGMLLANDTDPQNDIITVSAVNGTSVEGGIVTLNDGVIVYTPPSGTTLVDSFTYTALDSRGDTATATVTVTIANRAPVAADHTLTRYNDQPATVTVEDLKASWVDPDGDNMVITQVDETSPLGGEIDFADDQITYQTTTPQIVKDEDYFTYTVEDSRGAAATGYITVQLLNRTPVAVANAVHRYNDSSTSTITFTALLANDTDADGDTLTIDSVAGTSAQGGTVSVADGIVTYTPPALPFSVADSFTYTVKDPAGETATGTVNVIIDNRTPTPVADTVNRFNTEAGTVTVVTLLANDTDPDGDTLTFVGADATSTQGATITVDAGTVTYTAASPTAITGDDTFTYTVKDASNATATATVTVHLVNRAPTPQGNLVDRYNDEPGTITVVTLLANDTDPDGDSLTFVSAEATSTQGATITVDAGTVTYTAASPTAITGDDTFSYTVKDSHDETATAVVTVKLLNRAPVGVDDTVERNAGQPATVTTATLLANDTDPDGDTLAFVSAAATSAQGVPITVSGGTITYTPAALITGDDTFTYTLEDPSHVQTTATVTITTRAPSTAPKLTVTARSGGGVNLALAGVAFAPYEISVSTDLVTWTALTTVTTNASGNATAQDATAPAEGAARFYRAKAN